MGGRSGGRFRKVMVIGLDGLEPTLVAPLLAAGALPNLARLEAQGGRSTVATTAPAQTPVAWSTFATGTNPGGHGIFDFLRRDPKTYLPDLALNRYEQKSAWLPPKAVNRRGGVAVWDLLGDAGVGSTVLRCPCTYPPALDRGRMLAGMGVPDLRGGLGTPTFYTSVPGVAARESENVVTLAGAEGTVAAHLIGPRGPKDRTPLRFEFAIKVDRDGRSVTIQAGAGGEPAEVSVALGGWSDWLRVRFRAGVLTTVRGTVRFHLARLDDVLEVYASPVNFDPAAPLFPISSPAGYADELARAVGTYYTTGMVEDHTGLNNERISEEAFLAQCDDAWREREAMMRHELGRFDEGLFYCLFDTPDRVQHMFWRYREPGHPALGGKAVPPGMARVIEDHYRRADRAVGEALDAADGSTLCVALSDHGFNSFRRGFHINTWLHDQGLLALRDGLKPGAAGENFPACVDWPRTRAYAVGLGGVYLNLQGREGQGAVAPGEAEALKARIARGLTGLADPANGAVAVRAVKAREELYRGPFAGDAPDLAVFLASGYRLSWGSALGGTPEGWFEDNVKKWSGDHIIDPALVPGVLFMNRAFRGENARLLDLAPTVLDALGLPPGPDMEGMSLLS